jgi:hypothetical protein
MILEYIDGDSLVGGKYDKVLYDKFTEAYEIEDYEVLTPNGWVNIEGIGRTILFEEWKIVTTTRTLVCADKHIVYKCEDLDFISKKCNLTEIHTENLKLGDWIMTETGPEEIIDLFLTGESSNMYDLQLSEGSNKQYYTNGILSHNSLWMQNLAVKSANLGYNVLYITLEMSERKVMKRLGSMRLKIPINDYDNLSKDTELLKRKISQLNKQGGEGDDLFDKKVGKIITKFWAAGTCQVSDFDNYIQKLKDKRGIKIDLLVVDYIALIAAPKSSGGDNLYTKGKFVAESLRALASKWKVPLITAVQLAKDAWNSSDLTLESVPESKAIVETCDSFFGIIRTPDMQRQNLYRLKLLKQRDGDFLKAQIRITLNPTFLTLENDEFVDI